MRVDSYLSLILNDTRSSREEAATYQGMLTLDAERYNKFGTRTPLTQQQSLVLGASSQSRRVQPSYQRTPILLRGHHVAGIPITVQIGQLDLRILLTVWSVSSFGIYQR